jgi:hypothetical protein
MTYREWPEMSSFPKGSRFFFFGIGKKYNTDQNYVYNFSFPKWMMTGGQKPKFK